MKIMVLWKERPTRSKSVLSAVAADECGVCLMRHTEVQTTSVCLSSVPLVSRICPSDTYRVWKSGQCLRVDTTLMGFEQMTWQRGNRSFIFRGQGQGLNSTVDPQYMHDRSARLHSYWEILPILLYYMIIRYIFFLFFLLRPSTWVSTFFPDRLSCRGDGGRPRQAAGVLRDSARVVSHCPLTRPGESLRLQQHRHKSGCSGRDAAQWRAGSSQTDRTCGHHAAGHTQHRLWEVRHLLSYSSQLSKYQG